MYSQISSNKRKSILLMFGFLLVYAVLAYAVSLFFGPAGVYIIGGIAIVMVLVTLFMGDDMAVLVAGGRQIKTKSECPELWRMIENLSITAGIPMPRVYISPDTSPNAFAAGRTLNQAIVCVNQGLLDRLDEQELEGVIAHEISHIRNFDVRLMTYAAVLAGSIALISQILIHGMWFGGSSRDNNGGGVIVLVVAILAAILAPIAATIIQLAISRKREYVADASAAELTRYPQGLASALENISTNMTPTQHKSDAIAHMMIAAPFSAKGKPSKLFATHPPAEDRIARLMDMASNTTHNRRAPVGWTATAPAA